MRLVTFQDMYVIDRINYKRAKGEKPIYVNNQIRFTNKEEGLYNLFVNRMKKELQIPQEKRVIPVWAWVVPKSKELTKEFLDELYCRMIPKCSNMVTMELDVPKQFLFISNFTKWFDLLFKCKFEKDFNITDKDLDTLFVKEQGAILQAAMPFIADDFITNVYYENKYKDADYSKTEREVQDDIAKLKGENKYDPEDWY